MSVIKSEQIQVLLVVFLLALPVLSFSQGIDTLKISAKDYPDFSRVVVEAEFPFGAAVEKNESFLMVRIRADGRFIVQRQSFRSRFIKSLDWARGTEHYMLTVRTANSEFNYETVMRTDPYQLIIDIRSDDNAAVESESGSAGSSLQLPVSGPGVKTIVIDPGHGGVEVGAKGKFGTYEKGVTLAISLKLKAIIEKNMNIAHRVVLTRDKDVNVSLEERAAKANNNKATVFISIHANGSHRRDARGSSTYFLNLNATDEESRRLAFLENNSSTLEPDRSIPEEDDITMILWDMAQAAYLNQSSQLAESIQDELNTLLKTRNRGIKQAPFKVLTGVACPAALVEVAFISNPDEERKLINEEFQNRVARAIYRGLLDFISTHSQN